MPLITTFATTLAQVSLAIQSGADHIILEHPSLSYRSFSPPIQMSPEAHLSMLIKTAIEHSPQITLSINIDLIPHHQHLEYIYQTITALTSFNIPFRIQDMGLIKPIQSIAPNSEIHMLHETGNNNIQSISTLQKQGIKTHMLSNELSAQDIAQIKNKTNTLIGIQVQGPILIQYTRIPLLSNAGETTPIADAEDETLPNRTFTFYENSHGHFMYAHFHRCLLSSLPELLKLNLHSWIIDARGETEDYLKTMIQLYKQSCAQPLSKSIIQSTVTSFKKPMKPGFFHCNNTDSDWRDYQPKQQQLSEQIGTIIDVKKQQYLIMPCHQHIHINQAVTIITPEKKSIKSKLTQIRSIWNSPLITSPPNSLVMLPWVKGTNIKSVVINE